MQWWWLQVGGVLQKKRNIHTEDTTSHGEKKEGKKREKKKRGADYRTRELWLDSLMVSPPTLQRHELEKSIHATFLYPTSFLPAETRYIRIWYITRTSLKPRLVDLDVAIRNSLRSNKWLVKNTCTPVDAICIYLFLVWSLDGCEVMILLFET